MGAPDLLSRSPLTNKAARLSSWGVLPSERPPSESAGRPGGASPRGWVVDERDPRLDGPADRPLAGVSGRSDPGSPMDVLIPGEAVNVGLKVEQDRRRRDRLSGAGAPGIVDDAEAERLRAEADALAAQDEERRAAFLRARLRAALAAAAAGAFIALVRSGFAVSLLRPRRP